jgi:large subunit ribosomal protein L2
MALKQYKPTSPARRGLILVDKSALWKGKPVKALTEGKRKTGGRNNKGHVTSRGIAGGHKQKYRHIDFKRRTWDVSATVERLEYDPNRSAFIALVTYEGGEQAYIIAPQRLAPGDKVIAGKKVDVKPGNAMEVGQMPVGTIVHNVELKPGKGGQIARAAGTYVQVVGRDRGMVIVRLNSGEQRYVRSDCMATVGAVSNPDNANQTFAKAGRTRWMGKRPLTRGVAKNPVDHPHGGGEGRTSGGRHPMGQADQGCPHPSQQGDRQVHHSVPSREEEGLIHGPFRLERSVRRAFAFEESGSRAGQQQARTDQDLVAPFDDPAAVRRPDLQCLQRS